MVFIPVIASNNISGYTHNDLKKMAMDAKAFDGKPITDDDI